MPKCRMVEIQEKINVMNMDYLHIITWIKKNTMYILNTSLRVM